MLILILQPATKSVERLILQSRAFVLVVLLSRLLAVSLVQIARQVMHLERLLPRRAMVLFRRQRWLQLPTSLMLKLIGLLDTPLAGLNRTVAALKQI